MFNEGLRHNETLKGLDLPARGADHRCLGAPKDVIGAEAVQQIPDQHCIPVRICRHHPRQRAEFGIEVLHRRSLGLGGELDYEVIRAALLHERKGRLRYPLSNVGYAVAIRRSPDRTGPGVLCQGLRIVAGGHHLGDSSANCRGPSVQISGTMAASGCAISALVGIGRKAGCPAWDCRLAAKVAQENEPQ